ncbi:MAG: GGDEF domain-containing protein [Candidatus Saccharimonadaceae bacterium]|nr:GGDEF domain-containing protein [Candidatus Saccharimonadaceae bacterium]
MEKAPRLEFSKKNNPNFDLEGINSPDRELSKSAASIILAAYEKADMDRYVDHFTGCHTRGYLDFFAEKEFDPDVDDGSLALIFTDLDNLKEINDTVGYGHPAGDELIQAMVKQLRLKFGEGTVIVRTGGDEFLCLIRNYDKDENYQDDLKDTLESGRGVKLSEISENINNDYKDITLDYSYGIAIYDKNTDLVLDDDGVVNKRATMSNVLKLSDSNMYAYKGASKHNKNSAR